MVISISGIKYMVVVTALLAFSAASAGQISGGGYYSGDGSSEPITGETGFSVPQYDSQQEILTQLVAPFLLVAIILQIGIERALRFTMAEDDQWQHPQQREKEIKRNRKRSMMLSLVITGMLVPTNIFRFINSYVSLIFGSISLIFLSAVVIGFLFVLYKGFRSG